MKLLLIILIIFTSCCGEDRYAHRAPVKSDICLEFLSQRESERLNHRPDGVRNADSMFMKCRCDTLK